MNDNRCCEDRAFCRTCPERCFPEEKSCFPEEKPVTVQKPTPLDRFTHGFSQWVSRTRLPDLFARVAKAIQRVKKKE